MENTFASAISAETVENTMTEAIAEGTEMATSFEVEATDEDSTEEEMNDEEVDAEDVTEEETDGEVIEEEEEEATEETTEE